LRHHQNILEGAEVIIEKSSPTEGKEVKEWDKGYLVVMAKYKNLNEMEEYIDLIPILQNLYYDVDEFLAPIKAVRIDYAA